MKIQRARLSVGLMLAIAGAAFAQPANDACSSPTAISGFGTFSFDNTGATTDGLPDVTCDFFSSQQIYNDVWYCWTATQSGPVRARTCTLTTLDTKIAVYAGCTCPTGTGILGCSDDNCATQSEVSWFATAGQTYLIRLGTFDVAAFGTGSLELSSGLLVGPVINPANGHSYSMLAPSSWTAAEASAVALGGHLVTMNDAAENEWVRTNVLMFDGLDRRGWIGFNDVKTEGTFKWTSNEPATFTNWSGGEPNNSGGAEDWAEMFGNGFWNDNSNAPAGLSVYGLVEVGGSACYANCDGVMPLTGNDFQCFLNAYVAQSAYADCDGVGGLTPNDFQCFLNKYVAGCS